MIAVGRSLSSSEIVQSAARYSALVPNLIPTGTIRGQQLGRSKPAAVLAMVSDNFTVRPTSITFNSNNYPIAEGVDGLVLADEVFTNRALIPVFAPDRFAEFQSSVFRETLLQGFVTSSAFLEVKASMEAHVSTNDLKLIGYMATLYAITIPPAPDILYDWICLLRMVAKSRLS